jgi:Uncharacterised protein conserved in bacteria (DUF2336)
MIGFQPYETFQLLIETGGIDRANTLLVAACDAFARRGKPMQSEIEQFEALATRLFPTAAPTARMKAAELLGQSEHLSPALEKLVVENIGAGLGKYLSAGHALSEGALDEVIASGDIDTCSVIAARPDLSRSVLAQLFKLNSRKVYRALAANTAIVPRGPFLDALARSAQMDDQVASRLADRTDFDTALLAPAFFDLGEADRIKVIDAFANRQTPVAPIKKTLEQITVPTADLTRALVKLFSESRRPEVTRLMTQITGLDEVRCGQIAHDTSGAALFVVLRAFGCNEHEGLKVIIHATSHDRDRSKTLSSFSEMFQSIHPNSMAYLLSSWRGEVNLLDLVKPEYRPFTQPSERTPSAAQANERNNALFSRAVEALDLIGKRKAS